MYRKNFKKSCVFFILFAFWAVIGCEIAADNQAARVVKVYDGDTIKLADGRKVRLLGIDTPEAYESDKLLRDARRTSLRTAEIIADGQKASGFTRGLILGRRVQLKFDQERRDQYGRTLAYVYIPVCRDAGKTACDFLRRDDYEYVDLPTPEGDAPYIFLNATILKAGFARVMIYEPNTTYEETFRRLYRQARQLRRGLWAAERKQ